MLRAFFGVSVCASRASSRVSSASLQRCRDVQGCSEVCRAVRVCRVCCRRAAGVLQVRLCAVCSGCTAWARSRRDARRASRRPFPPPRRRCRCAWAETRERPRLAWAWLARPPPRRSRRERPARFPRSVASSEEQRGAHLVTPQPKTRRPKHATTATDRERGQVIGTRPTLEAAAAARLIRVAASSLRRLPLRACSPDPGSDPAPAATTAMGSNATDSIGGVVVAVSVGEENVRTGGRGSGSTPGASASARMVGSEGGGSALSRAAGSRQLGTMYVGRLVRDGA
eukprot:scaffold71645_cov66-Phaeocystis_antarctica.AAC.1